MLFFAPTTVSSAALTFAPTRYRRQLFLSPTTVSSAAVTFAPTTVSSAAFSFAPTTVSSAAVTFAPTTVSSAAFSFAPTTVSSAAVLLRRQRYRRQLLLLRRQRYRRHSYFCADNVSSAALTFAPTTVSSAALTFAPTMVSSAAFFFCADNGIVGSSSTNTGALTANGASNNGNGGSSRHRGHALQQCVETNMAHSGAQDDFLDFDCASAFAVNLSHAGNQGAYMEQDDVLSLSGYESRSKSRTIPEHQGTLELGDPQTPLHLAARLMTKHAATNTVLDVMPNQTSQSSNSSALPSKQKPRQP
ncbi:hypothetical protein IV203_018965 [Nitzschia inconspicua]|uniref:Uncharacterized protein n=1 Tax=Nitzschia inconspicua TaxID=303405 RepID=A0A9K3K5L7_9STRA|nr:hypothetical protein IV203_018965 [Nitzschia inconspicua]